MRYVLILLCLCCFACASQPYVSSYQAEYEQWKLDQPLLTSVWASLPDPDYGELPADYQEQIKNYFHHTLIDPMSAMYEFDRLEPYAYYPNQHVGTQPSLGIGVLVSVNAKNRMGGYTGRNWHIAFFHNGQFQYIACYDTILKRPLDPESVRP